MSFTDSREPGDKTTTSRRRAGRVGPVREEDRTMPYGTTMTVAILMTLVVAAPLAAGAADEKAQTATQDAKTMVSDSWLTSKTKISLFADERVKGTQIGVGTANGVVHLRGKVDSAEAKSAAGDVAPAVTAVKSV